MFPGPWPRSTRSWSGSPSGITLIVPLTAFVLDSGRHRLGNRSSRFPGEPDILDLGRISLCETSGSHSSLMGLLRVSIPKTIRQNGLIFACTACGDITGVQLRERAPQEKHSTSSAWFVKKNPVEANRVGVGKDPGLGQVLKDNKRVLASLKSRGVRSNISTPLCVSGPGLVSMPQHNRNLRRKAPLLSPSNKEGDGSLDSLLRSAQSLGIRRKGVFIPKY